MLRQVRRAIEWLSGNHGEARRYAAALIARELAENAPAVFNVHVRAFIDAIWAGLRDQRLLVRDASVAALRVRCSGSRAASLFAHAPVPFHGEMRCSLGWHAHLRVFFCRAHELALGSMKALGAVDSTKQASTRDFLSCPAWFSVVHIRQRGGLCTQAGLAADPGGSRVARNAPRTGVFLSS